MYTCVCVRIKHLLFSEVCWLLSVNIVHNPVGTRHIILLAKSLSLLSVYCFDFVQLQKQFCNKEQTSF